MTILILTISAVITGMYIYSATNDRKYALQITFAILKGIAIGYIIYLIVTFLA